MREKLFGTDGVRGRANLFPMTVEVALSLGKAIALLLQRKEGRGKRRVVIGKDTRLSGYMFENALIAGLCSMGVDTLMVGPLPTPGVAFITRAYRADAGIILSASHNPYCDNGIKIFSSEGFKLPDEEENGLEELVFANQFEPFRPKDAEVGRNKRLVDADGRYTEFAKATFSKGRTLQGLKIVLDCANGAAYRVAPAVFWELGAEVITLSNEPSGLNINERCGALHPAMVQHGVIEHNAALGIALDGDGDRVIMVDERGNVVDGDTILAICAQAFKREERLKNNRVVATVMTNCGVIHYLEALGIEVLLSKVGDRYVIQEMRAHEASLGGEQSGHMIFLDHNTTGDGIVTALQVLRIMRETESTLSELASAIPKFPQTLINVPVRHKPPLTTLTSVELSIREVERLLEGRGRVLVRYSGTENLCRVMVEGAKKGQVDGFAELIAEAIRESIGQES